METGHQPRIARDMTCFRMLAFGSIMGLALTLSSSCSYLVPQEEPTPTPVPSRLDEGKQTFEVQRGSIFDTIKALGRIVSKDETPLYFKQSGRLRSVNVSMMQEVKREELLAELDTADLAQRIETARLQMEIAQIELSRQIGNTGNIKADVKLAAAALVGAQAVVTRAQNDLTALESGPRPADLSAAVAAESAARANFERVSAQLATLRQPVLQDDLIAARAIAERTRSVLAKAQSDYDKIAWKPDAAGTSEAVALQQATADYQAARSALAVKQLPSRPEDITATEQALRSAREAVGSAQARIAQIQSGSRSEDVAAARVSLNRARLALSETQGALDATAANARIDVNNFDVAIAQKQVDIARVKYEGLMEELEMARIRAPYDGIITFITGQRGDSFQAFAPIAIISNPQNLEVSVNLVSADMARVNRGQDTIVTTEAFGTNEIRGKVIGLPSLNAGAPSSGPQSTGNPLAVRLSFDPPQPGALLGQLAQVTLITQQKDGILLVPNSALRRFGTRRYVQVLGDDGRRRDQDVEVGLVTETDTEITKGLREGQRVIVQ